MKKNGEKNTTKANENAKAAQFALFCICFVFFAFFPGTTSALMRTFTRQQYLLYPPRKKRGKKKRNKCENKAKKCKNKAEKNTNAFLFALPCASFLLCVCFIKIFWLLVSMAGVPDINIYIQYIFICGVPTKLQAQILHVKCPSSLMCWVTQRCCVHQQLSQLLNINLSQVCKHWVMVGLVGVLV